MNKCFKIGQTIDIQKYIKFRITVIMLDGREVNSEIFLFFNFDANFK